MKKIIIYVLGIIMLCFLIPILFTNTNIIMANAKEEISEEIVKKYDYSKYNTVKLLHTLANDIEEIKLDEYILGVVAAEMPASYELEALKAQAVVARTYTIYKVVNGGKHENADICDNPNCCQAWISKENRFARWEDENKEANWKKIVSSVDLTVGNYITYNGEPINALFHSNSGGTTELPVNVWGGEYPYLASVQTSGEDAYSSYNSEVILSKDELISKVLEKYPNFKIDFDKSDCIQILEYTESGRVKTLKLRKYSNLWS